MRAEDIYEDLHKGDQQYLEEKFRAKGISCYRKKTIISGDVVECEIYPKFKHGRRPSQLKGKASSEAQKKYNAKRAAKRITRLINTNFKVGKDMWFTGGYEKGTAPEDMSQAKRDVANYVRRLSYRAKKMGVDLKYVYVVSVSENGHVHTHIVSNFPDRDIAEQLWPYEKYPLSRRLYDSDTGLCGLAGYIAKQNNVSEKSYCCSKNLNKPIEKITDYEVSKKKAFTMATNEEYAREVLRKFYPNANFGQLFVYINDLVDGAYIHAILKNKKCNRMHKKGGRYDK